MIVGNACDPLADYSPWPNARRNRAVSESILEKTLSPKKNRFLYLLISLLLMLVIVPLIEDRELRSRLYHVCLSFVFLTAIITNWRRRGVLIGAAILGLTSTALEWWVAHSGGVSLTMISYVTGISYLAFTAALLLLSVVRDHMATNQAILGAICVYLLLGLIWALLYSATEFIQEQPFQIPDYVHQSEIREGFVATEYRDLVYFSFVTMSTLGYGEIVPRTPIARTLTWLQSVVGQLYLAVLVARLVSELPSRSERALRRD
jgi:hypothetical protein